MTRFAPYVFLRDLASRWDVLAFIVVIGLIAFLGETSRGLFAPLSQLEVTPLSLDPVHLPEYAARTTFRMLAGLFLSLVFTLTYATWAAKSERAGKLLVPILDILQSVPILGFISVTVVFFMSLAPGRVLGAVRGHLRHFHQPSLEHGLQLLSVAAHDPDRAHGSG
jgi:NitT/TauT family transport system permease protein